MIPQFNMSMPILPGFTRVDITGNVIETVPPQPCPELLTEEEAVRYLRLDQTEVGDPSRTIRYYREKHGLRPTQVGRRYRYRRVELDRLIENLTRPESLNN